MAEHHGGAHVPRVEDVLHRERIGPVSLYEFLYTFINLAQARGQRIAGARADHAAFHQRRKTDATAAHHAIAGVRRPRVDAEYEHADDLPAGARALPGRRR